MLFTFLKNRIQKTQTEVKDDSNHNPSSSPTHYVSGSRLRFHPNLINELKSEHRSLLSLYSAIAEAYESAHPSKIHALIVDFKHILTAHLLKENLQLYVYLKYLLADDSVNSELIVSMQVDMGQIGKTVFRFIDRYSKEKANYDENFKREFDRIGAALVKRIKLEEGNLYSLYMPPPSIEIDANRR